MAKVSSAGYLLRWAREQCAALASGLSFSNNASSHGDSWPMRIFGMFGLFGPALMNSEGALFFPSVSDVSRWTADRWKIEMGKFFFSFSVLCFSCTPGICGQMFWWPPGTSVLLRESIVINTPCHRDWSKRGWWMNFFSWINVYVMIYLS